MTSVQAWAPAAFMAAAAAPLSAAASVMAGIISSWLIRPRLRAVASTPMPRRLVSTRRSPARAPEL